MLNNNSNIDPNLQDNSKTLQAMNDPNHDHRLDGLHPKQKSKNSVILIALVAILIGVCIGIVGHNKAQAKPDARLTQATELIKQGNFDEARNYTNTSSYFSALDLIGEDGTNTQRQKVANAMYKDLTVLPTKVTYNKKGTKVMVTAKVSNYDVYSAALQVNIPASEAQKNSASENRKILVEKATKTIDKFKKNKKNKKEKQTVRFTMVKEDGKWVIDGNDSENQLSLLSFIGVQVEDIEKDQTKQETKKTNEKKNTKTSDETTQSKKNKKEDAKKSDSKASSKKTSNVKSTDKKDSKSNVKNSTKNSTKKNSKDTSKKEESKEAKKNTKKESAKKNTKSSEKKSEKASKSQSSSDQKSSKKDSSTKNKKSNTKSKEKKSKSDSKDNDDSKNNNASSNNDQAKKVKQTGRNVKTTSSKEVTKDSENK